MSSTNTGSSSLRPAWYKGGSQGGRGFQPPPTVTSSDRGDKSRSSSWGSQERRDSNKFSALQDDDDVPPMSKPDGAGGNSRSEAFRSSFNRSSSVGQKPPGRSLADLASRIPEAAGPGSRRSAAGFERGAPGSGSGRFSGLGGGRTSDSSAPSGAAAAGSIDAYKPDPKVIRFTREKLLAMRPTPNPADGPPASLKHMEGSVFLSKEPQDPGMYGFVFQSVLLWSLILLDCAEYADSLFLVALKLSVLGLAGSGGDLGHRSSRAPIVDGNAESCPRFTGGRCSTTWFNCSPQQWQMATRCGVTTYGRRRKA